MSPIQTRLIAILPPAVRADPKKSAILAALAIVMTVVMLKQFVFTSGSSAVAASLTPINASPTSNDPQGTSASRSIGGARGDVSVVAWLAEPIKTLDRNLFEFKGEFYPRSTDSNVGSARVIEDTMFWDQLAKSLSARADSKKQRQIRVDNLQQAAGKLKVQSTIMGPNPRAMVDGRMTRLGGTVEADAGSGSSVTFKVIKVEARRLVIERDGLKFEVPMGTGRARVLGDDE